MPFCAIRPRLAGFVICLWLAALPAAAGETADLRIDGWTLIFAPQGTRIAIAPPTLKEGSCEIELKEGTPGWRGPALLPGPAWAYAALHADTLAASLGGEPLVLGKDYLLDPLWAAVAAAPGGRATAGAKVRFTYRYGLSRLDLIERTADGTLVLVKGVEDKSQPLLPPGTPGNTPVLSVYLPNSATALSLEMINRIDPLYDGVPPVVGGELLAPLKAKLATGQPLTIVFLGDSITAQQNKDMRDQKGSYVDRFAAFLQATWPDRSVPVVERGKPLPAAKDKQIIIAKAGVGGDDTVRALKRIDADVLAHKPDLVVVMLGVNDENRKGEGNSVPVPDYAANLKTIIGKVRAAGAEVVLMTTSMKNLGWAGTVGNLAEYAAAMRAVASAERVCLIDNFQAWQELPRRGYNYMVFLGNCINHPVDLGHDLFLRGLQHAFK